MSFPYVSHGEEEEVYKEFSTAKLPNGQRLELPDGRRYRFVEEAGTAIVGHVATTSAVLATDWVDEAVATLAAGVTVLTGVGATTGGATTDQLLDGWIYSSTVTNLNPAMKIKSNTTITAGAATGTITLYLPTQAAFAAADTISYFMNPWKDIIIAASPNTAMVVGVTNIPLTASYYGWVQTRGVARCLYEGTIVAGDDLRVSATADGALEQADETAAGAEKQVVGTSLYGEATTECGPVFLRVE